MAENDIRNRLANAIREAVGGDCPGVVWSVPKRPDQGDLSTNVALLFAGRRKENPRTVAGEILEVVKRAGSAEIERAEIAGPGFINLWLGVEHYRGVVREILVRGAEYGGGEFGAGRRVIVEFVSANPTGPLNVVSARAAAIGDSLVRVLRKAGYHAFAEFYVNDAGRQVRRLGSSVIARARGEEVPEDGYHGEDIIDLARRLFPEGPPPADADPDEVGRRAAALNVEAQRAVLEAYGVVFDRWFRESELHGGDGPEKVLEALRRADAVYEKEGAVWFAGTRFGDDQDRVLVTREGRPTYLLPDIAYHLNKAGRGFTEAVDLLGPDHHDYVGRMQAALKALGHEGFLEVIIVQQVNLLSGGEKVKMSKRAGRLVTLQELVDEVGRDVTRYFFLQRRTSTPLDFDLDLAKEQSERNPVYYVQYAHTRICGILRQEGCPVPAPEADLSPLGAAEEIALVKHLERFGDVIARAAETREPQKLVGYLHDLAATFHKFYTAHRVVGVEAKVSTARAALVKASQIVLAEGLRLLGVEAPERM